MKALIQRAAILVAIAIVALFAGSEIGIWWALRLCAAMGGDCGNGPAFVGAAGGIIAAVTTIFVGCIALSVSGDER